VSAVVFAQMVQASNCTGTSGSFSLRTGKAVAKARIWYLLYRCSSFLCADMQALRTYSQLVCRCLLCVDEREWNNQKPSHSGIPYVSIASRRSTCVYILYSTYVECICCASPSLLLINWSGSCGSWGRWATHRYVGIRALGLLALVESVRTGLERIAAVD